MERTSDRVHTNPTGRVFQFRVRHYKVTFIKSKEGERFLVDAKEPVEIKLHANLPKEKFEALFGKGLPIDLNPGELTIQGSPLWEKIHGEAKSFQMRQQFRGFLNLFRLGETGQNSASLKCLPCEIEGGRDEWRLVARLPADLFTLKFSLDLRAIRESMERGIKVTMPTTLTCLNNINYFREKKLKIASLPIPQLPPPVFSDIRDGDRFRFELGVEGHGSCGSFTLGREANDLFSGIGALYDVLHKARAIARFFELDTRVPGSLEEREYAQIHFLFDLIQGREIPSPTQLNNIKITAKREGLAALLNASPGQEVGCLSFRYGINLPFLHENAYAEDIIHNLTEVKQITRRGDIKRMINAGSEDITIRFDVPPQSKHTVKLGSVPGE